MSIGQLKGFIIDHYKVCLEDDLMFDEKTNIRIIVKKICQAEDNQFGFLDDKERSPVMEIEGPSALQNAFPCCICCSIM